MLQNCMVYVNTLMIQRILTDPVWKKRLKEEDLRALTPLIYTHINPYGRFELDMGRRLSIDEEVELAAVFTGSRMGLSRGDAIGTGT